MGYEKQLLDPKPIDDCYPQRRSYYPTSSPSHHSSPNPAKEKNHREVDVAPPFLSLLR